MKRSEFLAVTGTFTGGTLLMPRFMYGFQGLEKKHIDDGCVVFIQLNGGNDGLNTFIPVGDPLYYQKRPAIGIAKEKVIAHSAGMGLHPALKGMAQIQQQGHLSIIQNVGYDNPNRSHFRSQEIWETASASNEYLDHGWLGRYLDLQCNDQNTGAAINVDTIDNLALKGEDPNALTIKNPSAFKTKKQVATSNENSNPRLDFVMKVAETVTAGSDGIQEALQKSTQGTGYPKTALASKLKWISRLIKGNLNSNVYYTSLNGFDTHDDQLPVHQRRLSELDAAIYAFYKELKQHNLLQKVTMVVFSEFGRRVKDNGNGTDHGTAAPMFVIGGQTSGRVLGTNPDLSNLQKGDLIHKIDFRSVFASLLKDPLAFDPKRIGIDNQPLKGLFL